MLILLGKKWAGKLQGVQVPATSKRPASKSDVAVSSAVANINSDSQSKGTGNSDLERLGCRKLVKPARIFKGHLPEVY